MVMELVNGNPKNPKGGGRGRGEGQDRLSSLPNDILAEILSRLPINTAGSTSVLSHQWRHLWTGVTRLDFNATIIPASYARSILQRLTSQKLNIFNINLTPTSAYNLEYDLSQSCHCPQNLHQFLFDKLPNIQHFPIPESFFNCQSLVSLELLGQDSFNHIHLPNLKKLSLQHFTCLPDWLGSLYKSSPLLEHLTLSSYVHIPESNTILSPNIYFPNLKSLRLDLCLSRDDIGPISIDAPQLTYIEISGYVLPYRFHRSSSSLVKSRVNLMITRKCGTKEEVINQLSKIFNGISTVRVLEMVWESKLCYPSNVFSYNMHIYPPIFFNLVRLEVTLLVLADCNNVFASLQCFPNLEHLSMIFNTKITLFLHNQIYWHEPDTVEGYFISRLKYIEIRGLFRDNCGLKLLRYILGNAKVLRKLHLKQVCVEKYRCSEEAERNFSKSLFELPRSSAICEIVVYGRYVTSTSNEFVNRKLNVKWYNKLIGNFLCSSKTNIQS